MSRRFTVLAAVAVGSLVLLAAAPASAIPVRVAVTTAAGLASPTQTYRSHKYGFSFEYERPFVRRKHIDFTGHHGHSALSVGVFDVTGKKIEGHYRDAFVVNVYRLNTYITADLLPAVRDELRSSVLPSLKASSPSMRIGRLRRTTVAGLKGFRTMARFRLDGTKLKSRMIFVFDGKTEYQLLQQSTGRRWKELRPEFRRMRASFTSF